MSTAIVTNAQVYFGTIECDIEGIEFLEHGITFKINSPKRCFPTLKYQSKDILSAKISNVNSECHIDVKGQYLFLKVTKNSVDEFNHIDQDQDKGGGIFNPSSSNLIESQIAIKIELDQKVDLIKYHFKSECPVYEIEAIDAATLFISHGSMIKKVDKIPLLSSVSSSSSLLSPSSSLESPSIFSAAQAENQFEEQIKNKDQVEDQEKDKVSDAEPKGKQSADEAPKTLSRSSIKIIPKIGLKGIDYEYTEADYQKLTNYKLFSQHMWPLMARSNPEISAGMIVMAISTEWQLFKDLVIDNDQDQVKDKDQEQVKEQDQEQVKDKDQEKVTHQIECDKDQDDDIEIIEDDEDNKENDPDWSQNQESGKRRSKRIKMMEIRKEIKTKREIKIQKWRNGERMFPGVVDLTD